MRRRVKGSIAATIGYVLSPLSWWNDPIVNIPLAYAIGLAGGLISPRLFAPSMVFGYWLTNVAGLALLHAGAASFFPPHDAWSRRRTIAMNVAVSAAYTAIILFLVHLGIFRFPKKGSSS